MSNDETCTISPADYEQISTLTKGLYSITRCEDDSICDLEITETLLNGSINEAVQVMNAAINRFNSGAEPSGREKRNKLTVWRGGRHDEQPSVFLDVDAAARLTRNCARMGGNVLAVAYKLGQRNVPKTEAMRFMAYHYTRVKTLFNRLCDAAKNVSAYERYVVCEPHTSTRGSANLNLGQSQSTVERRQESTTSRDRIPNIVRCTHSSSTRPGRC